MRRIATIGLLVGVFAGSTSANPRNRSSYLLFGGGRDFRILDTTHDSISPLQFPKGVVPIDVAISRDAQRVAYTIGGGPSGQSRLFVWDRTTPPRTIGNDRGYHADPIFSPDGRWIVFAHHPHGKGKPTRHSRRAYAQLYRIRIDGTGMHQLTSGAGCHFSPTLRKNAVLFVHSSCHGAGRTIERAPVAGGHPEVLTTIPAPVTNLSMSPDGTRLAYSVTGTEQTVVEVLTLKDSRVERIASFRKGSRPPRPQFAPDSRTVFYDDGTAVKSVRTGQIVTQR